MKVVYEKDGAYLIHTKRTGRPGKAPFGSVSKLRDHKTIIGHIVNYCTGNKSTSITTWFSRLTKSLNTVIDESHMSSMPKTSKNWVVFIKNWYGTVLTSNCYSAKLETRVDVWNKNIRPFLTYLQERDYLPIDVIVPPMKAVGQIKKASSFKLSIIGEKKAIKVKHEESLNKLLTPIIISRTDSDYLDELFYDLNSKRNKLHDCLLKYWITLKRHYEFGKETIKLVDDVKLVERLKSNDFYEIILPYPGKQIPPRKRHISKTDDIEGFSNYLFYLKYHGGFFNNKLIKSEACFPSKSITDTLNETGYNPFPKVEIEEIRKIPFADRVNWCLGNLTARDVSYISALLIMLNPKFTPESLFFSKLDDKHGKPKLELGEIGYSFTIDKERAKSEKKEWLDDISYDVLSTIIEMTQSKRLLLDNEFYKSSLFLTVNQTSDQLVIPTSPRITAPLTGLSTKKYKQPCLSDYFPSLKQYGLEAGTITHSKIRNTEGILEWFRTGSVKAVSRKLGNSTRVVLEHYIPKELLSIWTTRQVRRFQNLIIVAAVADSGFIMEAVDFGTLSEVNGFVKDMLSIAGDTKNPLINYLRKQPFFNIKNDTDLSSGDLIAEISTDALSVLYTYRESALRSNIDVKTLSIKDKSSLISPLAIITLSNHLSYVLEKHKNPCFRKSHDEAMKMSKKYLEIVNWSDLFLKRSSVI